MAPRKRKGKRQQKKRSKSRMENQLPTEIENGLSLDNDPDAQINTSETSSSSDSSSTDSSVNFSSSATFLRDWAIKHNISETALQKLLDILNQYTPQQLANYARVMLAMYEKDSENLPGCSSPCQSGNDNNKTLRKKSNRKVKTNVTSYEASPSSSDSDIVEILTSPSLPIIKKPIASTKSPSFGDEVAQPMNNDSLALTTNSQTVTPKTECQFSSKATSSSVATPNKYPCTCATTHQVLVESKQLKERVYNYVTKEDLPIQLPITNASSLQELNQKLHDFEDFRLFREYLKLIGGRNVSDTTRKILFRLIDNDLAMKCNWLGRNDKFAFGSLNKVLMMITDVVRNNRNCPDATDCEIEAVVKRWLASAVGRNGGRERMRDPKVQTCS